MERNGPRNTGHKAGIHPRMGHQSYTGTPLNANQCSKSTGFLLCLVEVHDAVDNLYTRVATEERDLIRKRFGG